MPSKKASGWLHASKQRPAAPVPPLSLWAFSWLSCAAAQSRCTSRCFALSRGSPEAGLLSCSSPTIPRPARIWAFWQGKAFLLPRRGACWCSAGDTLLLSPFHAGCRMAVLLWLCASTALLICRGMYAVTYRPLLAGLLLLPCCPRLWLCERKCTNGFLVKSEPLQCHGLP